MKVQNWIVGFLRRTRAFITGKPFFNVDIEHPIIEAFVSGGVQYYRFEDIFSAPFNRSFEAQTFYTELQMRVDKEYLQSYVATMQSILSNDNNQGINISDVAIITNQLAERMNFIVDSDLLLKLASVMYFDASENPYRYDFAYGSKKMAKWKANEDIADFFLRTPIKDFLPFIESLENDLSSYLRVTEAIKSEHKKTISKISSKQKRMNGL